METALNQRLIVCVLVFLAKLTEDITTYQGTNIKIDTHSSWNRTPFHNHRCPEQLKKGRGSQEDKNAKSPMYKSTWTYQCIHHQKE